jgi:tight adherence protein B
MIGPLLFGVLVALAVLVCFVALWRRAASRDPVDARLHQYSVAWEGQAGTSPAGDAGKARWSGTGRLLAASGLGPRLAAALIRADLPLTAPEFALIILGAALGGYFVGRVWLGPIQGLLLGGLFGCIPLVYLRMAGRRRQRAFTAQLPDVLTLLVGSLRAGYGLSQALESLASELPPPASVEFARVMRAVSLGLPIQRALNDMAGRVGTDDVDLVVTAITVQYEMGGNLAQTLETIGETVRERITMLREIRVLTAHQRQTAWILALLPIALGVFFYLRNPAYFSPLLQPGLYRLVPVAAVLLQLTGILVIRRIANIEV